MATIPIVLLGILEDLEDQDFERFKWYLKGGNMPGVRPIPQSKLDAAKRQDVVTLLKSSYGLSAAGDVAEKVLTEMQQNSLAEKLKEQLKTVPNQTNEDAGAALAPVAPEAPVAPVAPMGSGIVQNIKAESGGKVVAPTFTSGTFNSAVNFGFN